jgi:uncharacterized membrane protein
MNKKIVVFAGVAMVTVLLLAGCTSNSQNENNSNTDTNNNSEALENNTEFLIPTSDISTTAKFYSYDVDGITVRYFAVKDAQGAVHVAFDACDVCYEAKKGYSQNGDLMQCLNCGRTFSISSIGTDNTAGGCWPSYLPMRLDGNNIVINKSDLEAKSYMF